MSEEAEIEDVGGVEESAVEEVSSQPVGEAAPAVAEQPQQQDVWSAFRGLPQFQGQEDRAIAQRLYEAMHREEAAARALQQYQSIVPVAQEYLQHRPQYQEWLNSRSQPAPQGQPQPAPQPQQAQQSWWTPPQLKDSYKRYLTRDENGREVIDPSAPLDAKAALQDYQDYRANFAQKFLDNPEQTLGPMVEKVAVERAQQIVDQRFSRMQDEQYVSGLESENKDWLYDEKGNVSAEGMAVQKYIGDAKSIGISGAQARWDFATKMVERDLLLANLRQSQMPQQAMPQMQQPVPQAPQRPTAEQQNMDFLRQQAMRTASQRSSATTTARTPAKPMTFEERLMSAAQEEGLL
jgi:hypothetical protein